MTPTWVDVNARSRGLSTHLLDRAQLELLAEAPDLPALAAGLIEAGLPVGEDVRPGAGALDLAVRREAATRLATLARWCGRRTGLLAVIFEDEDRRSLRAILRGAAQGAAVDARLSGLVPTPGLSERALGELARQPMIAKVAALLAAWRHPLGSPLLAVAGPAQPDLFTVELALGATYAARALAAARRAGRGGVLERHVRGLIDIDNAAAAMVLAPAHGDVKPKDAFLPGGAQLDITAFEQAVASGDAAAAALRVAEAFGRTALAAPFRRAADDPTGLEEALLRVRIRRYAAAVRRSPLGPEVPLHYALRLRAEVLDLTRIIWGVALGAPCSAVVPDLVTA